MDSRDLAPTTFRVRRTLLAGALKVAVSVGLLAILITRTDVNSIWSHIRSASAPWLALALALYFASLLVSTWRWKLLLDAQGIAVPGRTLLTSYLVATFFNNFLPSNIGGDVIRIRDTAAPAGSKTVATSVVLIDRAVGLMGLVLVAAVGATVAGGGTTGTAPTLIWPAWLWAGFLAAVTVGTPAVIAPGSVGRLLKPLTVFHAEWVGNRIARITAMLGRLRARPSALAGGFMGAILVQAILVLFYAAVARSFGIQIALWHMAVIVPISFIMQMLPVSVNGFGVREATFSFYFSRLGLPMGAAIALSLGATALIMFFSLSGAACYAVRRHPHGVPAAALPGAESGIEITDLS
jgi:uncharacterized protein (TIRG00374 family)